MNSGAKQCHLNKYLRINNYAKSRPLCTTNLRRVKISLNNGNGDKRKKQTEENNENINHTIYDFPTWGTLPLSINQFTSVIFLRGKMCERYFFSFAEFSFSTTNRQTESLHVCTLDQRTQNSGKELVGLLLLLLMSFECDCLLLGSLLFWFGNKHNTKPI